MAAKITEQSSRPTCSTCPALADAHYNKTKLGFIKWKSTAITVIGVLIEGLKRSAVNFVALYLCTCVS